MGSKEGWRMALLAASILSSCFLLIEGQGTIQIQVQPEHPIEGQDVTLTPEVSLDGALFCSWYRGWTTDQNSQILTYYLPPTDVQSPGPAFTDQETLGTGCSLHITNLTSGYTRNYTVNVNGPGKNAIGSASVVVSEILANPVLESAPIGMVGENTNVTLNCNTSKSPDVRVFWFKDGKPLSPAAVLLDSNRTLVLVHITKNDSGFYRCSASNTVSQPESNLLTITVAYGPEIKLDPEGTIERTLNSELKLECIVDCVPAAKFQWFFNNIKRDETGKTFRVRLSNWTDAGNYSCEATNPFTNRTAVRTTYVKLTEGYNNSYAAVSSTPVGVIAGITIGTLAVTALMVGIVLYFFLRARGRSEKASTQTTADTLTYENVTPSGQVKTNSTADSNHIYEALQHADQSVYQQLKGSRQVSQPSPQS